MESAESDVDCLEVNVVFIGEPVELLEKSTCDNGIVHVNKVTVH